MQKKFSLNIFVLLLLSFFLGWSFSNYYHVQNSGSDVKNGINQSNTSPINNNIQVNLDMFWKVWESLNNKYLHTDKLDNQKRVYGAIKGMVNSLNDPYTVYMDPAETKEFQISLNGQLEGIGAELTVKNNNLTVVSVIKDSPAKKAGLKSEDIIYKINNEIAADMTLYDAIMKIRGPKDTNVTLSIIRSGQDNPLDFTITRADITVESVSYEQKANGISYIAINQFGDKTKDEFEKAIGQVLLSSPKGLIIDLRFNGGGYLDSAVDILSELFNKDKKVVLIKERDATKNEVLSTSGGEKLADIPLVVLVNKGSASASEIVAGAIQDYKRGTIVGTQTFGKGSVQEVETFDDNSSLRLTIAEWHTPNDRSIDGVGITPDVVVDIKEEDATNNKDPQLDKAMELLQK